MNGRLTREDWINEGLRRLVAGGVQAVGVEALAKALGVTKGSFYWHFADRRALLDAMLEDWRAASTSAIIAEVEAAGGDALTRLRRLSRIAGRLDGRLDVAIRGWSASDAAVSKAQAEIDAIRLTYLEKLYHEIGFDRRGARARAEFVYHALIGRFALAAKPLSAAQEEDRQAILLPLMTRRD